MRRLPDSLREYLNTTPIGTLAKNTEELLSHITPMDTIISIGDRVSHTLLQAHAPVQMIIVDYIHKRQPIALEQQQVLQSFGDIIYRVENPPACISDELYSAIAISMEHLNTQKIRIDVDGEEDLASLVVISLAPSDVTVIYGVPDKGVLIVPITHHHKDVVNDVLDQM